jgi:hypothetical protein
MSNAVRSADPQWQAMAAMRMRHRAEWGGPEAGTDVCVRARVCVSGTDAPVTEPAPSFC